MQWRKFLLLVPLVSAMSAVNADERFVAKNDANCDDQRGQPFCSINSALARSNRGDIIRVAAGTYNEMLTIDKDIVIEGAVAAVTTVDAQSKGRVLNVMPGARVALKYLTITGGIADLGAGIYNEGVLRLEHVVVDNNTASASGGGIYNATSVSGSLAVVKSVIRNNHALGDDAYNIRYGGGGIFNAAPLQIEESSIEANFAKENGGGIYSVFSSRRAPTAAESYAEKLAIEIPTPDKSAGTVLRRADVISVTVNNAKIVNNHADNGGGVYLRGALKITNSLIDANDALLSRLSSGGGIHVHLDSQFHATNTIFSRNQATMQGGGIRYYATGSGLLDFVSVFDNRVGAGGTGAGVFTINGGVPLIMSRSVLAQNGDETVTNRQSCVGPIQSQGYNFVEGGRLCRLAKKPSDRVVDAKAKKLAAIVRDKNNERWSLKKDSALIDAIPAANCQGDDAIVKHDLYGEPRPFVTKGKKTSACDIGAVEYRGR